MTVTEILTGPVSERHNHSAHLMTEAEARFILIQHEKHMPKSRRGSTIKKIAQSPFGRLSDEARALYMAYAACYGA